MKNHTRRPRAYYETLYQRRLDEGLTFANLSADSGVPVATLQYWFRRFKAEQGAEHPAPSDGGIVKSCVLEFCRSGRVVVLGLL